MDRKLLASAVGKIAWAYVLLHLDVKVMGFDLLPSWGAWLLILSALRPLAEVVPSAALLRPLGIVLAVWSAVCWLPLGLGAGGWLVQLVGLVMQILALYCHFQLLTDLAVLAGRIGAPDRRLRVLRTVYTVLLTLFALPLGWAEWPLEQVLPLALVNVVVAIWIGAVLCGLRVELLRGAAQTDPNA